MVQLDFIPNVTVKLVKFLGKSEEICIKQPTAKRILQFRVFNWTTLYLTKKKLVKPASSLSGGSSCYLASMSSADFDDTRDFPAHTNLASSLSMSEADESEYLATMAAAEAKAAASNPAEHQSPPVS